MTTEADPSPRARFGHLLRRMRVDAGLTQAAIGTFAFVSPDAVATWERGRSLPDESTVGRLDQRLKAGGALVAAWREARTLSRPDRDTVGSAVGVSATSLLATTAREAAEFGAWAERTATGDVAITALTIRARDLATAALTSPPADVIASAGDLSRETFTLLRGHNRPTHARDLYTIAGLTCALLAWMSGDLGALDAARVHGSTAQACADLAERPELSAWVAAVRSKTAFWCGEYQAAADLACRGLRFAAPGTVAVMLACQQADAFAKLGARDRVLAALASAQDAAEHRRGEDSFGGLFSCAAARHANYVAAARLTLGDAAPALAAADGALTAFCDGGVHGFGTVAQVHISRAYALALASDLDGAAVAARPVLDLPATRRLATLTGRLQPLRQHLDEPGLRDSTVGRALREEIVEFCTPKTRSQLTAAPPRQEGT